MAPSDEIARLRRVAELFERWAESLPRRDQSGSEPWYEFLDLRFEAETRIIEQIRRTVDCSIQTCAMRRRVQLTVAGVSVRTNRGIEAALQKWVRKARERLG